MVAETGLCNLTRNKVTLLVHRGSEKPQHYRLTRFQSPPADTQDLTQLEK
jgi:hypothetical protein